MTFTIRIARHVVFAVALFALAGCMQSLTKADMPRGTKVLVVNMLPHEMTNAHLGITVFSNYAKPLENSLDIPGYAFLSLQRKLASKEISAELWAPTEREKSVLKGDLYIPSWTRLDLKPDIVGWFESVMSDRHADAIILLSPYRRAFHSQTYADFGGYGIASMFGSKPDHAQVFAFVGTRVFSGHPPVPRISRYDDCRIKIETAQIAVDDLENATGAQLEFLRPILKSLVDESIERGLRAAGILSGEPAPCAPRDASTIMSPGAH